MLVRLDTETRSSVDIRKSNPYAYSDDPNFSVLMLAYAVDDEPVTVTIDPDEIRDLAYGWLTSGHTLRAHNAAFDRVVLSRHLGLSGFWDPACWEDPAIWAAAAGLPRALAKLTKKLGVAEKEGAGTALINYFSKPQRDGTFRQPEDDPERWSDFVRYCKVDVEVMRECDRLLQPLSAEEQALWVESERINDRGVAVDVEMAKAAVAAGEANTREAKARITALLGIDNGGSVQQLTAGLAETGLEVPNLRAETVTGLLAGDLTSVQREVLELRQELSLASHKKFAAALQHVCADGRVRGMFRFYGASTGRYSGQAIQLQNLSRASLRVSEAEVADEMLARTPDARGVVADRTNQTAVDELKRTRVAAPSLLKKMVRPLLTGPLTVCDFSSIEARVLAWLAGEQWALDAFRAGRDIYEETACLAEGSKVLTNHGLTPIESVTREMLLWDGTEWVTHEGVVFNGYRDVIYYDGLWATPDHRVWIDGSDQPVLFDDARRNGWRLTRSGDSVRLPTSSGGRQTVSSGGSVCESSVLEVYDGESSTFVEPQATEARRMQVLSINSDGIELVNTAVFRPEALLHRSEVPGIPQLWRSRNKVLILKSVRGGHVDARQLWATPRIGDRPDQQRRTLRAGELTVVYPLGEQSQSKEDSTVRLGPEPVAIRRGARPTIDGAGPGPGGGAGARSTSSRAARTLVEDYRSAVAVYDVINAGPRNRFTAEGRLVHNCRMGPSFTRQQGKAATLGLGYGGGVNALRNVGMSGEDDELKPLVVTWRKANPRIVNFWGSLFDAWVSGGTVGKIRVMKSQSRRDLILPSGRAVVYQGVRFENYWSEDSKTGQKKREQGWRYERGTGGRVKVWTGIAVENCIQAVARDLLGSAIMNCAHLPVVGHVHDELIIEGEHDVSALMCNAPKWAAGLPLAADGYTCRRYRKS